MRLTPTIAVVSASLALAGAAFGQEAAEDAAGMELPAACGAGEPAEMEGMEAAAMEGMPEHNRALMRSMMATHGPMMQGAMAEDPDVAFACAMIPHHQSAIDMAEIELEHGDSEPMRALAQEIIDAQQREIAVLTQWLEEQAQ